jgi:hypothetical protein
MHEAPEAVAALLLASSDQPWPVWPSTASLSSVRRRVREASAEQQGGDRLRGSVKLTV